MSPHRGFTLVELMFTLAILAVLATMAFPVAEMAAKRSKEQDLRYHLRQLREAIDAYKLAWDEGRIPRKAGETGYPKNLELLVEGVEDVRDPKKAKILFLRRIPADPMAPAGTAALASWGKRAYASPHDEPKEGEDVYDVYSLSPDTGLNGIPYRQW